MLAKWFVSPTKKSTLDLKIARYRDGGAAAKKPKMKEEAKEEKEAQERQLGINR